MKIESINTNNSDIAVVITDNKVISNAEDGLNLVGDVYYNGFNKVILKEEQITPEFFDLKTGLAGEVLQKFSNYNLQLAIIGDFSKYTSKSLQDFIFESNNGKKINFVYSEEEAIKVLAS